VSDRKTSNARFILPLVGAVLVIGLLARYGHLAAWLGALAGVGTFAAIPALIGYLFVKQSGWRDLSRRYPAGSPAAGEWKTCPTAIAAIEPLDSPEYETHKVRLNFIVRVADDDQALYVSTIALLAPLFPPMRIPWSAIAAVRYFDPSGWYRYPRTAGLVFQLNYDPGYKGLFVEIQIAEPSRYLQLPAALIERAIAHFPTPPPAPG